MQDVKICRADIDALKAPEWLSAYLDSVEPRCEVKNGVKHYVCPFHIHDEPDKHHLRVTTYKGEGRAMCKSRGEGRDIFDTAQAYGDGGGSFPETVRRVAERVGYTLRDESHRPARKGRRRQTPPREMPRARQQEPAERADEEQASHLSPAEEAAALEAVKRLHDSPSAIANHAAGLNVPETAIFYHSDLNEDGAFGLLGEDERGHLLHLYTYRDETGRLRVRYTKTRLKPYDPNAPTVKNAFATTPKNGVSVELWGADALRRGECLRVIITEGESDCLAVRAAVWSWLDVWAHNVGIFGAFPPQKRWPLVLGKPGAGIFKREWLTTAWGRKLLAADVILARDNDEAGRVGAEKTASLLLAAGARRVYVWRPPDGVKDAREALDRKRPWLLADDIMENKKAFQSNS